MYTLGHTPMPVITGLLDENLEGDSRDEQFVMGWIFRVNIEWFN